MAAALRVYFDEFDSEERRWYRYADIFLFTNGEKEEDKWREPKIDLRIGLIPEQYILLH